MRNSSKVLATALVLSLAAVFNFAQTAPSPSNSQDYSKEAYVVESLRSVASFENDGTGTRETTARVRVQSEAGVQAWGLLTEGYSSANEQVEVAYVRVHKADGTVVETPAVNVQDVTSDITRMAPVYSDYHEKHVTVKGLGVGDALEYDFKSRTVTPLVPGQFWFEYDFFKAGIALDEQLVIRIPKARDVKVKSPDLKPAVTDDGDYRVYTWKSANRERKDDQEAPLEVPPPAVLISTFKSWEEVGKWWDALERDRVTPTPDIRAKAAELTKDAKTDDDKVRAIYSYVATRFRYVSISFGIGRYQPHAASEVLQNEYGDCKDKHTLLASLLQAAGIAAYPALMNSARKIDPDVPSPGQFDHVISALPQEKKLLWMDTTAEVAPIGWLAPNLRDKESLLVPVAAPASLTKTPADSPIRNSLLFEVDGKLDDKGTLEANVQRTDRGDLEVFLRIAFRATPQPQWKDLVQRLSYLSGFAGDVSEVTASPAEATDQPFRFSYKYVRKDYSDWGNNRISPPLQLCSLAEMPATETKSTKPLQLGGPADYDCKSKIALPKGYSANLLAPAHIIRDFAEYHATQSFTDGVFAAERRLTLNVRELPATRRSDYAELQKAVNDNGNLMTSFDRGESSADLRARADTMSADELNTAAANLLDKNQNPPLALDLLRKATAKDPNHKLAWNNLGRAYFATLQPEEAITAYKKQIEINPKDEYAYKNLASAYNFMKRYPEAVAVYRQCIEVNPQDKDVYGYLGWVLAAMEKWSEAAQAYQKSAELNPDNPYPYTQWARALIRTGKADEARKQLDRALDLDSGPATLNNVAWERADAGIDLDIAEDEAKLAVSKAAANLAGPFSFDISADYHQQLAALGNMLDTLGWIFFQEGELEEAEPYLLDAYELQAQSSVAEHLARLRARQGKFDDALRYYAFSQMTIGWTGHANKELEEYLAQKSGGEDSLRTRVIDMKQHFNDQRQVAPAHGAFKWPKESTITKAAFVNVCVLVDATGAVTDAQVVSGDDPFREVALADARELRLPALAWPGHALPTVRTLTFLYKPPSMKSSERRVQVTWWMGKLPSGFTSTITADGEHVVSFPANLMPESVQQGTSPAPDSPGASGPDYTSLLREGAALRQQQNLEGAIRKFRQAVEADPSCPECHALLAETLALAGYRAAAILEYKELVRLEPDNPDHHFMLGAQFEAEATRKEMSSQYSVSARSGTNATPSAASAKSARSEYEAARDEYCLADKLAPNNHGYKQACQRLERQLRHP